MKTQKLLFLFCGLGLLAMIACNTSKGSTATDKIAPSKWSAPPGTISAIGDAGSKNVFTFEKWRFTKATMPDGKVEQMQIALEISTASLTTGSKDLQKSIRKKKDYFYIDKFPLATVTIDGAKASGNGQYSCEALLTLKGISKVVPLTFSISDNKPYQVKGEGMIFRSNFNFTGGGPKEEVPLSFEVTLPL